MREKWSKMMSKLPDTVGGSDLKWLASALIIRACRAIYTSLKYHGWTHEVDPPTWFPDSPCTSTPGTPTPGLINHAGAGGLPWSATQIMRETCSLCEVASPILLSSTVQLNTPSAGSISDLSALMRCPVQGDGRERMSPYFYFYF